MILDASSQFYIYTLRQLDYAVGNIVSKLSIACTGAPGPDISGAMAESTNWCLAKVFLPTNLRSLLLFYLRGINEYVFYLSTF